MERIDLKLVQLLLEQNITNVEMDPGAKLLIVYDRNQLDLLHSELQGTGLSLTTEGVASFKHDDWIIASGPAQPFYRRYEQKIARAY